MNSSLTKWLITGALGAGFIVGCNHSSSSRVSRESRPAPVVAQNPPYLYGVITPLDGTATAPAPAGSGSFAPPAAATLPPISVNTPEAVVPDAKVPMRPPIILPAPPAAAPPVCTATPPPVVLPPVTPPEVVRIQNTAPSPERTPAKSEARLGHADDYHWLCGTVSHDFKKPSAWRLRYMPIDQTDDYGGALTLVEDESQRDFKEGMHVEVWGRIREADGPGTAPMFFVDRATVLSKP